LVQSLDIFVQNEGRDNERVAVSKKLSAYV